MLKWIKAAAGMKAQQHIINSNGNIAPFPDAFTAETNKIDSMLLDFIGKAWKMFTTLR